METPRINPSAWAKVLAMREDRDALRKTPKSTGFDRIWQAASEWGLVFAILAILPSRYSLWRDEEVPNGRHSRMLGGPEISPTVWALMLIALGLGLLGLNSKREARWFVFILTILAIWLAFQNLLAAHVFYV